MFIDTPILKYDKKVKFLCLNNNLFLPFQACEKSRGHLVTTLYASATFFFIPFYACSLLNAITISVKIPPILPFPQPSQKFPYQQGKIVFGSDPPPRGYWNTYFENGWEFFCIWRLEKYLCLLDQQKTLMIFKEF